MIQYQATRITNAQATAVAEAIARSPCAPPNIAFSHTHGDLEAMFGGAHGLRAIAEEKRLQLVASDRPN